MAALGGYVQVIQDWMPAWIEQYRPGIMLQMPDEPAFARFMRERGVFVVGRAYTDDQKWSRPADFAQEHYERIMRKAMLRDVSAWMGANEPPQDKILESIEFDLRMLEMLSGEGVPYIVGSYSTGVPSGYGLADPLADWDRPEMIELMRRADRVAVHEYCAPRMDSEFLRNPGMHPEEGGYYTLRHKLAMRRLRTHLLATEMPDFYILEAGIDSGACGWDPGGQGGWKSFTDVAGYMEQVRWYIEHSWAAGVVFFIFGTYYNQGAKWPTFDLAEPEGARRAFGGLIVELQGSQPPAPPVPPEPPTPPEPPGPGPGPGPAPPGPGPEPDPEPEPPAVVGGIDVSQYQEGIDWVAVSKSRTVERVMIRASSGLRADRRYHQNWLGAGSVGIRRGAYHYLYPGDEWQQAWLFLEMVEPGEEPCVLDVEQAGLTEANVLAFVRAWESMTSEPLMIYTAPAVWRELVGTDAAWARAHDLWIAHWGVPEPSVPAPWENWRIWQYSAEGTIPGIEGPVDLDWFKV